MNWKGLLGCFWKKPPPKPVCHAWCIQYGRPPSYLATLGVSFAASDRWLTIDNGVQIHCVRLTSLGAYAAGLGEN